MELKITEKNEKSLLSRTEIKGKVTFSEAVPSKESIKKDLATKLKISDKLLIVKNIYSHFKSNVADVLAYHYMNEEDLKKIEGKNTKVKKKPAEVKSGQEEKKA